MSVNFSDSIHALFLRSLKLTTEIFLIHLNKKAAFHSHRWSSFRSPMKQYKFLQPYLWFEIHENFTKIFQIKLLFTAFLIFFSLHIVFSVSP